MVRHNGGVHSAATLDHIDAEQVEFQQLGLGLA
jgi:hypothetical protein